MSSTPSKSTNEKTTIYLDPKVKKGVQYYALRDDSSLSQIINDRLLDYLEEMADVAALQEARNDTAEPLPFEQVVKDLGLDFDEIQRKAAAASRKAAQKAR